MSIQSIPSQYCMCGGCKYFPLAASWCDDRITRSGASIRGAKQQLHARCGAGNDIALMPDVCLTKHSSVITLAGGSGARGMVRQMRRLEWPCRGPLAALRREAEWTHQINQMNYNLSDRTFELLRALLSSANPTLTSESPQKTPVAACSLSQTPFEYTWALMNERDLSARPLSAGANWIRPSVSIHRLIWTHQPLSVWCIRPIN
jgi:hypothetical protein